MDLTSLRRSPRPSTRGRPYPAAILAAVGLAVGIGGLGLKGLLGREASVDPGFLPLLLGVAIAAWLGGVPAGIVATLAGVVGNVLLFDRPAGIGSSVWIAQAIRSLAFIVVGSAITSLAGFRLAALEREVRSREAEALARGETERALERLRGLQSLLERLASTTTPEQVADAILGEAIPVVGATGGAVVMLTADHRHLRTVSAAGSDSILGGDVGVHEAPALAEAVLLGKPSWGERLPRAAVATLGDPDPEPSVLVPLRGRGPVIGALAIAWDDAHRVDPGERLFIEAVARQCGQALERAMLLDAERQLRRDTEVARQEAVRLGDELGAVLHSIGEPILVAGPEGRVTLSNRAADTLLGKVGHLDEVVRRLTPVRGGSLDLAADRTTEVLLEGSDRMLEVSVFGVRGRPSGSRILAIRDVTEARRSQEAREVFIGVLSHELRTPVTTILGGVDLLARGLPEEDRVAVLEDVSAESERLRRLIEDVLVLSRFERQALDIEDEPVLVQRVIDRIAATEARRGDPPAEVRVDLPLDLPPVRADQMYLEQILRNLIANAVKYGAAGGPIQVRAERAADAVRVVVADRGPGFPKEDADRLFELFYRSKRTATKPGAGIGLFVSRQLAHGMGGALTARPRRRGGAEFVLTLRPFQSGEDGASAPDGIVVPAVSP